jgi:two-component system KDP operon response regulator KdpE
MERQFRSEEHPPAAADQGPMMGDFPRPVKKSPKLSVLVVDDEPLIRWSLAETLADAGHQIVEAGDAQAAVQAVTNAEHPFDVVLLDFRLPDSDDLSLLSRLRLLVPASRIIMMTAFGTPEMTQGALDLGADCVVTKPFDVTDLATLIQVPSARPC